MKNLYSKSKGKIHPSPATPSAAAASGDALSVLKLLPAAIFVLTAALSFEDKEVVAYLIIRSINGSDPAADAGERRRCRRIAGVHRALFDCGCFDCYTSFWSRWDCSRDREVIHMVIEAFEEHLASKEKGKKGKEAKRKRKKGIYEKKEKETEKEKFVEVVAAVAAVAEAAESKCFEEEAVSVSDGCCAEEKEHEVGRDEAEEEEEEVVVELPAVSEEKRSGWADVVGMFNSRLWSLWSPDV